MLDPSADALARHLLSLLPPGSSYRRADLDRLPLPVAHYLGGVLDRRLAREGALPESDWFDADTASVQTAAAMWHASLHEAARFPADVWETTVRLAARQLLAYLVTPVETLTDRVFADGPEPLDVAVVRTRLGAFSPYPYLREISEGYLERKGLDAIGRDDFERLLRRVDQRMASTFEAADWLALLEPLFDLLDFLPDRAVPAPLLRRFFEAKEREDLARRLAPREAYDATMLHAALADAVSPTETAAPSPSPPTAQPAPDESEAVERKEDADPEAAREAEVPLWQRLATAQQEQGTAVHEALAQQSGGAATAASEEKLSSEEPAPVTPAEASAPEEPGQVATAEATPKEDADEPLWKRFSEPAGGAAETDAAAAIARSHEPASVRESLTDLERRILGPSATERRDWFMNNLTGGSESEYRAVLNHLAGATSWTEATQIIAHEVFRKHRVNIYSDAAIAFTDAVEARFRA